MLGRHRVEGRGYGKKDQVWGTNVGGRWRGRALRRSMGGQTRGMGVGFEKTRWEQGREEGRQGCGQGVS